MMTIAMLAFGGILLLALSGGQHAFLAAMGTICIVSAVVLIVDMGGVAPIVLSRTEPVIRAWVAGLI
jgi:hypothetical protein